MGSQVVPLRIDKEVLEAVDKLVELGVFNSRTEALRELVKTGLRAYENLTRIAEAAERLLEIEEKEGEMLVRLDGGVKTLLEDRDSG